MKKIKVILVLGFLSFCCLTVTGQRSIYVAPFSFSIADASMEQFTIGFSSKKEMYWGAEFRQIQKLSNSIIGLPLSIGAVIESNILYISAGPEYSTTEKDFSVSRALGSSLQLFRKDRICSNVTMELSKSKFYNTRFTAFVAVGYKL